MIVTIRLYGILRDKYPEYDNLKGMEIDIPESMSVEDLLIQLNIDRDSGNLVIINGKVAKPYEQLIWGSKIEIYHLVDGG